MAKRSGLRTGAPYGVGMESLGDGDPRSVGGYPLFARLGAGGMGQVFLARTPAGRALALKTVRGEFGADPAFGKRFTGEIRNADRVRSPWTVAVVDFSPEGAGPSWLATEYVAAPSLAEWVAAHGPLQEAAVASLAAELCRALEAVHQAGLAHRDVKPSNVLLAGPRPLLIDFGIARAAEDPRHTRAGAVIGSPGYMAPEQATAGVSAEPGDMFALGAVLVHAATGHAPSTTRARRRRPPRCCTGWCTRSRAWPGCRPRSPAWCERPWTRTPPCAPRRRPHPASWTPPAPGRPGSPRPWQRNCAPARPRRGSG
jgi:serine/threonine protein kinase